MLVLLPPSESKQHGGDGPPLDLDSLSFPALTWVRARLVAALVNLAGDPTAARATLGLSDRQDAELALNAALRGSPTLPALHRYTGVLYDALDYSSLRPAARGRADASLVVASALFGLVRPTDPIPGYRLSGGTILPGVGRLAPLWRPVAEPVLATGCDELVVDLRSVSYAALARVPGAVAVRVVTERTDGTRAVVSHHNKATKGRLARALVSAPRSPRNLAGVLRVARAAGLVTERTGDRTIDVVT
ncbi:MAG TPA: peroxide stress protein YaaA [Mycobacteriales bacterium]